MTRKIIAQAPLARYRPEESGPDTGAEDDETLADAAGRIEKTILQPVGSVRMGADAAVPLEPQQRHHSFGGLRVVDASLMPTITSGNTNAPTIMIAGKADEMILEDARTPA